jgi:hypothetical protein
MNRETSILSNWTLSIFKNPHRFQKIRILNRAEYAHDQNIQRVEIKEFIFPVDNIVFHRYRLISW